MTFSGLVSLALSLLGTPSSKQRVIVGETAKSIAEYLAMAPDIDPVGLDRKVIDDTVPLCTFLASCPYERVFLLYHGYNTGIWLNQSKGRAPDAAEILRTLKTMPVTSAIKEIELFSCLTGKSAAALFEIAQYLKTRLFAGTELRHRNRLIFNGMNDAVLKNLEIFRNYFVLGPEPDIKTYLQRHQNTLVQQFFYPQNFEDRIERLTKLDYTRMSINETREALSDVRYGHLMSHADAPKLTISDLPTATAMQADFLSPQHHSLAWIEFVGGT